MKHIYIGTSRIEGKGIFAGENIKKGESIELIKGKARFLTVKNKDDSLSYPNWIGIGKNKWIEVGTPGVYLNHSCNPNSGIEGTITSKESDKSLKGSYTMTALHNIKKGEEITIDYSITECDGLWEMKCACGEKNCRKIVRSIQYLPERQFKKYFPYVPTYFKNLYLKGHQNIVLSKS